jgi:hypothetical protein
MTEIEQVQQYTKKLNLTFTVDDCNALLLYMDEFEIVDYKTAVWEYLDAYEGICHSRDPEFFKNEENQND